jgi:hypothetical protein
LAGFATWKLTLEMTFEVARLPHRAQFTARFSDPAPWQRTSVTAWHFLQRNSKSGIVFFKNLRAKRPAHAVKLFDRWDQCQIISG